MLIPQRWRRSRPPTATSRPPRSARRTLSFSTEINMFKKTPMAGLEADMAALTKRQTSLAARVASTSAASLAAIAARRLLLTENDEPEAKALADADRACRTTADAEGAAVDALSEIEARIVDLRGKIDRTRVADGREREAAALEAAAKRADAAISRIARAAAEIATARADLAAAVPPDAVALYFPPHRMRSSTARATSPPSRVTISRAIRSPTPSRPSSWPAAWPVIY